MNTTQIVHLDAVERRENHGRRPGLALGISVGLHLVLAGLCPASARTMPIETLRSPGPDITVTAGRESRIRGLGYLLPVRSHPQGDSTTARPAPKPDDFAAEEPPIWDQAELLRRVRYPEIARRNRVEGGVVIHVLVAKNGRVAMTSIEKSDNKMLSEAAVDAINRITFTPAKQNGHPIDVWIRIPMTFTLE